MITVNIDPIIFSFGHFMLRWYALIVASAILVVFWLSVREAMRKGFDQEELAEFSNSSPCRPGLVQRKTGEYSALYPS